MRRDVKKFVSDCQTCQQMKDFSLNPVGLLQPLPIPELVFKEISMDFITSLPASHKKTIIMAVVDHLSKYGHFIALPGNITSESVVAAFVSKIIRLHGILSSIVTDRDLKFMNSFGKKFKGYKEMRWQLALLITRKLMAREKLSISALKCTCSVSLSTLHTSGLPFYDRLNTSTTRHFKLQQA